MNRFYRLCNCCLTKCPIQPYFQVGTLTQLTTGSRPCITRTALSGCWGSATHRWETRASTNVKSAPSLFEVSLSSSEWLVSANIYFVSSWEWLVSENIYFLISKRPFIDGASQIWPLQHVPRGGVIINPTVVIITPLATFQQLPWISTP